MGKLTIFWFAYKWKCTGEKKKEGVRYESLEMQLEIDRDLSFFYHSGFQLHNFIDNQNFSGITPIILYIWLHQLAFFIVLPLSDPDI